MAELTFDVVITDCGPNQAYDRKTIENRPLGGVESSVIRIAEGLGSLGLTVAVIKASDPELGIEVLPYEPTFGQTAFYMHEKEFPRMDTKYHIVLRGPKYVNAFPNAKKLVWCHDLATPSCADWLPVLEKYDATVVAVSRWHKRNIQEHLKYEKVTHVYNPLSEDLYLERGQQRKRINRDLMVWASSPHKGLDEALGVFKKVHEKLPSMKLLIYNPGYLKGELVINPGTLYNGPTAQKNVLYNLKNALCLFYPTEFQETFGLVAAEANAVGTPMIGYKTGALNEIVQDDRQLTEPGDEVGIVERILDWHQNGPPVVYGRDEFRTSRVIHSWLRIFAGKL